MLINKENITSIIPQRAPFIMIDSLIDANETGFNTKFEITSENLFLENGILSESSLIENIAQTCAAGFGYLNSLIEGGEPKLGFIGAVTQVQVEDTAKLNDLIETSVQILSTFDTIHLVEGTAKSGGKVLLTCQMKIVLA
jgi:3-hydroxymyristoyl/3-hydroxydecanoyl-(acyl carrier protein) dehydratase